MSASSRSLSNSSAILERVRRARGGVCDGAGPAWGGGEGGQRCGTWTEGKSGIARTVAEGASGVADMMVRCSLQIGTQRVGTGHLCHIFHGTSLPSSGNFPLTTGLAWRARPRTETPRRRGEDRARARRRPLTARAAARAQQRRAGTVQRRRAGSNDALDGGTSASAPAPLAVRSSRFRLRPLVITCQAAARHPGASFKSIFHPAPPSTSLAPRPPGGVGALHASHEPAAASQSEVSLPVRLSASVT